MGLSKIYSAQTNLLNAHLIDIETDISNGLFSFSVVGLADKAVEESKDRVSSALKNSGFKSPKSQNQKVVVSLAPADLKKEGPAFDLAIAIGYLLASEEISFDPSHKLFLGELSLDGKLRPIKGTLPLIIEAKKRGITEAFVPEENAEEAALVDDIKIFPVKNLRELVLHFDKKENKISEKKKTVLKNPDSEYSVDFGDIAGNACAKRALLVAATGGHNVLMSGPPGTGKTMLARALQSILPPLSKDEAFEITGIHSVAGTLNGAFMYLPPVRSPHHTSSYVALVGGGATPKPGEATLAHNGVLFLDELPEFDRRVIEALREPLEEGFVSISRAKGTARFPARFMLVGAMNPCPCGNYGIEGKRCICPPISITRYRKKISGPLLDRIDIFIEVSDVDHKGVIGHKRNLSEGKEARKIVADARNKALEKRGKLNSHLPSRNLKEIIGLDEKSENILVEAAKKLGLSARSCHKIMRVAQSIADIDGDEKIAPKHILEAIQYREKKDSI